MNATEKATAAKALEEIADYLHVDSRSLTELDSISYIHNNFISNLNLKNMGTLLAGLLGIALVLLVIGLGIPTVWNGLKAGVEKATDAVVRGMNYFLPGQQNNDYSNSHPHGLGLNKV